MSTERTGVAIREAELSDAGSITRLADQLGYASSDRQLAERLRAVLRVRDDAVCVAVDSSGAVIGWIHVAQRQLVMSERFAEIEGLVVDEAWRRQGVGRQLVRAAERWALERGHNAIRVRSNVARDTAHDFYRGEGFSEIKRQVVYRRCLTKS